MGAAQASDNLNERIENGQLDAVVASLPPVLVLGLVNPVFDITGLVQDVAILSKSGGQWPCGEVVQIVRERSSASVRLAVTDDAGTTLLDAAY